PISLSRQDVPVDRVFREFRLQHAEQIQQEREHERSQQEAHVRLEVTQQPPRHLKIVSLPDRLFLVILLYRRRHIFRSTDYADSTDVFVKKVLCNLWMAFSRSRQFLFE